MFKIQINKIKIIKKLYNFKRVLFVEIRSYSFGNEFWKINFDSASVIKTVYRLIY